MKKSSIIVILLIFLVSCDFIPNKEGNNITSKNNIQNLDSVAIYNSVLKILLKKNMYNRYLGENGHDLNLKLIKKEIDSASYLKKINELTNKIINNNSLKRSLFINDNTFKNVSNKINTLKFPKEFRIDSVKANQKLNKVHGLSIKFFKSDLAYIKSISELNTKEDVRSNIGILTFSKLYINTKEDYGLLYFEFVCGNTCGEADVILLKKVENQWRIEKLYSIWEM